MNTPRQDDVRQFIDNGTDPIIVGPFTIGTVDEVNGRGAEILSAARITRHEAQVLADYWHGRAEETLRICHEEQIVGSDDTRVMYHGWQRAAQLREGTR